MKRSAIRRKEGWVTSWLASRLSLVDSLWARLELFMVPSQMLSDGSVDDRAVQKRYFRVVGSLVLACVAFFAPSLVLAGVPTREWPAFIVEVVLAACVISWSLLFVRPHAKTAILAAAADAVVIAGLTFLLRDYYHQVPLLLALVVAGHATINGLRAAMVAVAFGSVLVPLALTVDRGFNATDPVYALAYLSGIVTVVWIADRLSNRVSSAVRASESKYRLLVERVPAIVYTAGFGHDAGWQRTPCDGQLGTGAGDDPSRHGNPLRASLWVDRGCSPRPRRGGSGLLGPPSRASRRVSYHARRTSRRA